MSTKYVSSQIYITQKLIFHQNQFELSQITMHRSWEKSTVTWLYMAVVYWTENDVDLIAHSIFRSEREKWYLKLCFFYYCILFSVKFSPRKFDWISLISCYWNDLFFVCIFAFFSLYIRFNFLCLMAKQFSWAIQCQNRPCLKTLVVLFKPLQGR